MNALGRHIIVELYDCKPSLLDDVTYVQNAMQNAAQQAGATIINLTFHHFSPYGVSGVVVIQESHLAIHTWPEWGFASIDLFTCGESTDPWKCYRVLKDAFLASHGSTIEMRRGQLELLKKNDYKPSSLLQNRNSITQKTNEKPIFRAENQHQEINTISKEIWFTERDENLALSLKHKGDLLFKKQSSFQKVEVFDTFAFGKALVLDGLVVATEKDEAAYHEMLVHPAFTFYTNSHSKPKKILIIGGGDGGTAREVLRYDCVEKVIMIEQDKIVTEAAKAHFEGLASALENPKLELVFSEANHFFDTYSDKHSKFDIIIVDAADTTHEPILDKIFFQKIYNLLADNGILATQCDAPRWHQEHFVSIINSLKETFLFAQNNKTVLPYLSSVASLPTGMWGFACASKNQENLINNQEKHTENSIILNEEDLSYYNEEIQKAAFCLPNFIKKILK
ncbi:S-adenosylmethionine decarboxylase proenzyme [Bernardetia litoralis DSM 6794]|uniref:S-adenosylmethionine decarboxylase proenzyme n=1 Tax=Bernardetia litoralis (strain ATCC 23117 / DSM 6794 / NBRC 15988 / NCIMB 1366 / Fx l1 / Sio-4) TaxID=880071 RepID=I4AI80_BERLS|nr:adenosylmethionine decarboxylase [Bernardetia litoralis]AFM03665.1 S-adenosylmethionine decarboxylase proenzyme [Bernardetia litoralis DSM 6794]